ncbi:hypothetical protein HKD37_19G053479 [Glycine soja]
MLMITKGFCISIDTLHPLWFMLLCCIPCFLLINLRFIRGCTRTISTNLCFFLVYQLNIFSFNFCFVNYSVVYKSKGEMKDIELVEEEQARIGADSSSETSNKSENYKEEARNASQKHKPKRVESVNADAEAFDCCMHSEAEALEHMKKKDTGHQSVSLENKTGDSTMLKIGNLAKFVIKQDMKGIRHKYGFNNNKREKAEKVRVVDDETGDKHQLDEIMGSPPASTPPPPPPPPPPPSPHSPPAPPPPSDASASPSAVKRTRKASRLRSLSTRPPGAERPVVHVDVTYENWKEVPTAQKDLIWEDIQAEFDIPEASDSRTKRKLLQTLGRDGGSLNQTSQGNGPLQPIRTVSRTLSVRNTTSDVRKKEHAIQKQNTAPHVLSRGGYDYLEQKLLAEKMKKKLEEAAQSGSVDGVIDPPSPVRRHMKWKMARTKKTGEMTTEATKEIAEKIVSHFQLTITIIFQYFVNAMYHCVFSVQDSFEEQATQGSFVPHGRQDVLAAAIGRPEHPGRVRTAGASVTIKQYFGSAPRTSRSTSSLPPDELQQLAQQIRDQLEDSITKKVTHHMQSQLQSQMQSQGLAVPPEPLLGTFGPRVSTKGSCVDPSRNDPEMGDSDRCGLYIEADPARLVAMGRVYEGSAVVHNTPLLPGQVKVSVEEVTDADAPVPVPTDEVSLAGQALHTFLAWSTHLVKSLSQQVVVSPAKPPPKPDPEVDDPLYLMTLTIPELFLRPYQVRWDATVFGVFNPDFPLYIKHEDLFEIAHGGQCLSILLHKELDAEFTTRCLSWSLPKWMVVILPKEHLVVWFCSLHNRPDNYLKGIINSALKGLDDAPQPKSKASASTECSYYVMHWMSTIILGTFRNNWEAYFNDPKPLEPERLKALRIQWAQFYLQVRDQA